MPMSTSRSLLSAPTGAFDLVVGRYEVPRIEAAPGRTFQATIR
jgi:hypothetical protein